MHKINFPQYYVVLNDEWGWPTEVVAGPFNKIEQAEQSIHVITKTEGSDKSYSIGIKNLELEF